jgi:queuine tRNA-ribosyltransferase
MAAIKFTIKKELQNSLARAAELETTHGLIKTPAFVTVGTKATVKALTPDQVKDLGAQVVLGNTYHLYLEPGDEKIKEAGGIHKFMNWSGPTMTDSGGFQVFSLGAAYGTGISKFLKPSHEPLLSEPSQLDKEALPKLVKIDREGVMFRSHIDGSAHYFTPEKSIEIQHNMGADIIFAFDECTSPTESFAYQREALDRTHSWAKKSLEHHHRLILNNKNKEKSILRCPTPQILKVSDTLKTYPALFGIVQGGREEKLRKESAEVIGNMKIARSDGRYDGFDGFGIGGSFEKADMSSAVKWVNEILPKNKPRHLLGIGEPEDLFMAIENGCDLFDCVAPTRIGRTGTVYTPTGKRSLLNSEFKDDWTSIQEDCSCYTCKNYTKGYLAHLFRSKEMLGATLASIHNLHFIIHLVDKARESILNDTFSEYKKKFLNKYL